MTQGSYQHSFEMAAKVILKIAIRGEQPAGHGDHDSNDSCGDTPKYP